MTLEDVECRTPSDQNFYYTSFSYIRTGHLARNKARWKKNKTEKELIKQPIYMNNNDHFFMKGGY